LILFRPHRGFSVGQAGLGEVYVLTPYWPQHEAAARRRRPPLLWTVARPEGTAIDATDRDLSRGHVRELDRLSRRMTCSHRSITAPSPSAHCGRWRNS